MAIHRRLRESRLDPALIVKVTILVHLRTFKVANGGTAQEDRGLLFMVTFILSLSLYN